MDTYSLWAYFLPPISGAITGYFTNWLAIKMLFRPLSEKKIFGIKLPFTPGILPRERSRIAEALGNTVSEDLLDEKTITDRLMSNEFKLGLDAAFDSLISKFLSSCPADYKSSVPNESTQFLSDLFELILKGFVNDGDFSLSLKNGIDTGFESVKSTPLNAVVPLNSIENKILLSEEKLEDLCSRIADLIYLFLQKNAQEGNKLSCLLSEDKIPSLTNTLIDTFWPYASKSLSQILSDSTVKKSMERSGVKLIKNILNKFSGVQRFFISLGQYDKAIIENMPSIILDFTTEIKSFLSDDATKKIIKEKINNSLCSLLNKEFSKLSIFSSDKASNKFKKKVSEFFKNILSNMPKSTLVTLYNAFVSGKTFADIMNLFPNITIKLYDSILNLVVRMVNDKPEDNSISSFTAVFLGKFADGFVSMLKNNTLADSLSINEEKRLYISQKISSLGRNLLLSEVSSILKSINIKQMVVEKINSLHMIEIEEMLLRVVNKELNAITVLGGVLGAIIGSVQTIIMLLEK